MQVKQKKNGFDASTVYFILMRHLHPSWDLDIEKGASTFSGRGAFPKLIFPGVKFGEKIEIVKKITLLILVSSSSL